MSMIPGVIGNDPSGDKHKKPKPRVPNPDAPVIAPPGRPPQVVPPPDPFPQPVVPGKPPKGGGGGAGVPKPPTWTDANRDAYAALQAYLEPFGLGAMLPWVKQQIIDGVSVTELKLKFFEHPAFRQRFPIYDLLRAQGYQLDNVPDPARIIQYEDGVRSVLARFGVDPALAAAPAPWDGVSTDPVIDENNLVTRLLLANKDLSEVEEVMREGYRRVTKTDPLIRSVFAEWYGVAGDAMLAMHFIAPSVLSTDELIRQAQAAEIGGYGRRQMIDISEARARAIALSDVSAAEAQRQFQRLDEMRALFDENLAESTGPDLTIEGEGVEAAFGLSAGGQTLLRRRLARRVNQDRGGSSTLMDEETTAMGTLQR